MKKALSMFFIFIFVFALIACGESDAPAPTAEPKVVSEAIPEAVPETTAEPVSPVDVDLTQYSGTMLYSQVYDMLANKDAYIGKTVRMRGNFAVYMALDENHDPIPDQYYFACVIADATACCQQGIEFVLSDDVRYPEDYPQKGAVITVTGEFQTYLENGDRFAHLVNAEMTA